MPDIGKQIAYQANRDGVAERFEEAAVQKTIEVDIALITYYDERLKDLELYLLKTAKQHDANTLYRLQTVPGIGKILSLVLLDEIHDICRFPSVQHFASYGRLVKCSKESGGKRLGTSGKKRGYGIISRSRKPTATRLCNRHARDDGTSIRVGCSHLGWRPKTEMKSEHKTEG